MTAKPALLNVSEQMPQQQPIEVLQYVQPLLQRAFQVKLRI